MNLTALRRLLLVPVFILLAAPYAGAQPLTDTLFTWQGYGRASTTRLQIYPTPQDEERSRTIVLRELARSRGPSTVEDARFLAEAAGRHFGIDPAEAYWIFYWGPFSYEGAEGGNELFLRATFHRTETGRLSSPYWRVISKAEVRELTDRRFRE